MDNNAAREAATKLARRLGDEAWRMGHTKHAFEAWEASDITPAELFEKAEILLFVPPRREKFLENDRLAFQVVVASRHHADCSVRNYPGQIVARDGTLQCFHQHETCKARFGLIREFHEEVCKDLGWDQVRLFQFLSTPLTESSFYMAAALACLKLIKRSAAAK